MTYPDTEGFPVRVTETCVLVGNGPSVLVSRMGRVIDAFDHVVRFNAFKLHGFESHVGSRTTLCSNFGRGVVPFDNVRPDRVVYPMGSTGAPAWVPREMWRISDEYLADYKAKWAARDNPEGTLPSSGYLICSWLLDHGVERVHLAGFDHFGKAEGKAHHYWGATSAGTPRAHRGPAEAEAFLEWVRAGRVFYLG